MSAEKDLQAIKEAYDQMTTCEKKAFRELVLSIVRRIENESKSKETGTAS